MILERRSGDRGHVGGGWLDSRHTFSFGHYHDPEWMGFSALRVINEDRVAPSAGFPPHRHANMEILSYVLEGELTHRDDNGGGGVIRAGELQWMSAGHGIEHSEYNASDGEPAHFLQVWIQPDRLNAAPAYAQREAIPAVGHARWTLLASPDGHEQSLAIRQDARLQVARLAEGDAVEHVMTPSRRYWLQPVRGTLSVRERTLSAGDALGFVDEAGTLTLYGVGDDVAEVLLFDLPA